MDTDILFENALLHQHQPLSMSPWSQRLLRTFHSNMAGLYQYFHLIFGTAAYQPQQPTEDTVRIAQGLFEVLKERKQLDSREKSQGLTAAKLLVKECTDLDSLLQVTDASGYNVIQVAVLQDDRLFIQVLLMEGCDLNRGKCSLALHLACRLGNLDLVQFLLRHGASPNVETGMCYPKSHVPVRHVPSRFHFLETDIYACDSNHQLPVMYAIQEDHVDVVRCLMEANGSKCMWPYRRQPLHFACKHGAYKSMQYLAIIRSDELNDVDEDGFTPLLHAVQWGKTFVQHLVEAGAKVNAITAKNQMALHLLFTHIQNPMELYDTTKFLLGSGLETDINGLDHDGNSALHVLISELNCVVDSFPRRTVPPPQQQCFDQQVLNTLELLLVYNCDPNVVSNSGVTAMHKLLLTYDFVISNDPTGITFETLPAREKYKTDFAVLYRALDILLRHGANPNMMTGAGRTPLIMLLHCILNVDPHKLPQYMDGFIRCLRLLCDHGAQPSVTVPVHITTVISLCKLGYKCLMQRDEAIKATMAVFLKELLALLLQNGLDCNHQSWLRKREIEGDSGNILVELVKLSQGIRAPSDLLYIHSWVLTALQWGANPDIEPYPSDSIICTSQSSIYLKPKATQPVNQYMYHIQDFRQLFEGGYAERLLDLFVNSMDHSALYSCLSTAKFMSRFDPSSTKMPSSNFISMVNKLTSQPRSLKQVSRVAIYKAIDRQLNLRVQDLPLPTALKEYLINVEEF